MIALSGFSSAAGVDSKSRQSALRKARVVVVFAFLWFMGSLQLQKGIFNI